MSASPIHYQKRTVRCVSVIAPFLRRLNMGTLAFVLFVALALLSTTSGKDAETRESVAAGSTKIEVVVDKQHDDVPCVVTKTAGQMVSPSGKGHLKVYSVSDEFNDGAYYVHSCYDIYSTGERLFEGIENNISGTDELIPWHVVLSIGFYTVVARSARSGEVCVYFCYQGWAVDDCRSGFSRTGDTQTMLGEQ